MQEKSGFLLIKKPKGTTSFGVVEYLRKITGTKKIGHAGTLDPMAEGLLIIGIGREATKKISQFLNSDKEYIAKIRLGAVSDTYDAQGKIRSLSFFSQPTKKEIKKVLAEFKGEVEQIPPLYSAKKIKGKRAYQLARKNINFSLKPQKIKIYQIKLLNYSWPSLTILIRCSKGTYIRSLADDIGKRLGCGGYLEKLLRTKIGRFDIKKGINLFSLTSSNWQNFLFK